jgi:hypothetical protein
MKILAVSLILLSLLSLPLLQSPSTAEAQCSAPRYQRQNVFGNWHAYWVRTPGGTVYGVKSYILNYDPYVWPNGSASTAWVMLTRPDGDYWAQVGWIELFNNIRHTVVQVTTPEYDPDDPYGTLDTWFFPSHPVGAFTEYRVEYTGSLFTYWAGSSAIASTLKYFTPTQGEIAGEILNLQSQMPGGYNSPEAFQLSYIKTGGWIVFDGYSGVTPGYSSQFGALELSPTQAWIWDWLCSN